jgi:uncharacterized protein YceK
MGQGAREGMMNGHLLLSVMIAALLGGCGTFATLDPAAPASHHAQRKYDDAVKKGSVVPIEKGNNDRK